MIAIKNEKRIFAESHECMIICFDSEGQLCNRLWGLLPVISNNQHKRETVIVLFFEHYLPLFPSITTLEQFHFLRLTPFQGVNATIAILVRRWLKASIVRRRLPLSEGSSCLSLVNTWEHREEPIDLSLHALYARVFLPDRSVVEAVTHILEQKRIKTTIIMGVHIRRRDYITFEQGRFFYSDAEYLDFMKQVVRQIEGYGMTVTCLLCSDEPINHDAFVGLDTFSLPEPSTMHDLYALSHCDCVIGAPSTFSQWASFYGQVPLWLIWDKKQPLLLENFGVCVALDKTVPTPPETWLKKHNL